MRIGTMPSSASYGKKIKGDVVMCLSERASEPVLALCVDIGRVDGILGNLEEAQRALLSMRAYLALAAVIMKWKSIV